LVELGKNLTPVPSTGATGQAGQAEVGDQRSEVRGQRSERGVAGRP